MKRKYLLIGIGIIILLALNLWQWWPRSSQKTPKESIPAVGFSSDDFRLKISTASPVGQGVSGRDLFRPKLPPPAPIKKIETPPMPPPKTPEQLAEEAARAELAQIKLVGVVFRGEKGQAFLVKGDQVFLAQVGDKVGSHFVVESIGTDNVQLKDTNTNVSGQLPVSGK